MLCIIRRRASAVNGPLQARRGRPQLSRCSCRRKDPWETINLADDPAHAATRRQMAGLLRAGWKAAAPP